MGVPNDFIAHQVNGIELVQQEAQQESVDPKFLNNDSNHTASSESRNYTSSSKPRPRLSYSAYDSDKESPPEAYDVLKKISLEDGRHFFCAKRKDQTEVRLVTCSPDDDQKELILREPQPFRDTYCLKQVHILQRFLAISTTLLTTYFLLEAIVFTGVKEESYLLGPLLPALIALIVLTVKDYLLVYGKNIAHHTLNLCLDYFFLSFYTLFFFFFLLFLGWAVGHNFLSGGLPVAMSRRRRVTYHTTEITLSTLGLLSSILGLKEQYTDYKQRKENFLPIREEVNGKYRNDFLID